MRKPARTNEVGLKHVAGMAGVSIKTVSNVVNNRPYITAATRAKVEDAIRRLGYRPNAYARGLRSGRSGVIGLAIPFIDQPYFGELARSVVRAAARRHWTVLIDETEGTAERELEILKPGSIFLDGLILSPLSLGSAEIARHRIARPLVLLGERCLDDAVDNLAIDNVAAARKATEHLIEIGRRRIAAIGDRPNVATDTARLRIAGYQAALKAAGLVPAPELLKPAAAFSREEGARAMTELLALRRRPDAVFCFSDLLAVGAIRAIHDHGLQVPKDVAVIGFDDIAEGRFSVPSLSTISPDKDQLGEHAIRLLEARLGSDGSAVSATEIQIEFELKVRESTAG